jgi:hypothetical protein
MDDYEQIETKIAKKHGAVAKGTKKAIGDFLLEDNEKWPVNVKSNNVDKNNYSPNMISAKRLIKWLDQEGNKLFFIFVDYKKTDNGIVVLKDTGLIPVEHLSWDCLTIEAQGWGVIQMPKPLKTDESQDRRTFFRGMKEAYEQYMEKERKKMDKIREMIKNF